MFPAFGGDRWWPLTSGVAVLDAPLEKVRKAAGKSAGFQVKRWESAADLDALLADFAPFLFNWSGEPVLIGTRDDRTVMLETSGTSGLTGLENFAARHLKCAMVVAQFAPRAPEVGGVSVFLKQNPPRRFTEFRTLDEQRRVGAVRDGGRWHWAAWGPVQPYEDLAAYERTPIPARMPLSLLGDYLQAEGVPIDDPDCLVGEVWLGRRSPSSNARWWHDLAEVRTHNGYLTEGVPTTLTRR